MMRDRVFLYIIIIDLIVMIISFWIVSDIFNLGISYHLEQIFWFILITSLAILYISCIFVFDLFKFKKKVTYDKSLLNKKTIIGKIVSYWNPLLWIGLSFIVIDALILGYLKSLLPLDDFNNITKINHPVFIFLYIIMWIGTISMIISFLSFTYLLIKKKL